MPSSKKQTAQGIIIDRHGGWDSLRAAIGEAISTPGVKGIMVLAGEANGPPPDGIDRFFQNCPVPVFGGVFPSLIANDEHLKRGNIIIGLQAPVNAYVVPSLSDPAIDYDRFLSESIPDGDFENAKTMFVFVDGLAPRVGALICSLFNTFGLQGNFIGGGAGSLTTQGLRCLITPQGLIRDAAVLAIPAVASAVSVAHGWTSIAGPYEVTASENNTIFTLDWEPALDVYRRVVGAHAGMTLSADNFNATAQSYPFGIARIGAEFVVRDPVALRPDGAMTCVGDVPRGSMLHIMHGKTEVLLAAAGSVRAGAEKEIPQGMVPHFDIFMDCVSRGFFLGNDITRELHIAYSSARPMVGAFTLGEIANSGREHLEFHNKTSVMAIIGKANGTA
ncbi:MAG: FIST C-terminal domain-containing protein [Nitrospinae bacterium]|nr:FIST C-terminal domain-containing protein [Nitrospinota bacterium]